MKNALIQGTRICEFVETQADQFPVAAELIWVEVADNTTTEDTYVDGLLLSMIQTHHLRQSKLPLVEN